MYYLLLSFRIFFILSDGFFYLGHPKSAGWTHLTLNYIRYEDGQGIRMYYDGREVASDTTNFGGTYSAGDGRIVVGRIFTDRDENYASIQVDELIYFNKALTTTDIKLLYNET